MYGDTRVWIRFGSGFSTYRSAVSHIFIHGICTYMLGDIQAGTQYTHTHARMCAHTHTHTHTQAGIQPTTAAYNTHT